MGFIIKTKKGLITLTEKKVKSARCLKHDTTSHKSADPIPQDIYVLTWKIIEMKILYILHINTK